MNTLFFPLFFICVSAIFLWFLIGAKGHWIVKIFLITLTMCLSFGVWNKTNDLCGYAATEPLPDKFELYWAMADEPKEIYIWAKDLNLKTIKESRLYSLPYSKNLHKQVEDIKIGIKGGKRFRGTMKAGKGAGNAADSVKGSKGNGEGEGKGKGKKGFGFDPNPGNEIYELPPPVYPNKDPQK